VVWAHEGEPGPGAGPQREIRALAYLARQVRQGSGNIHNSTSWAITQPIGSFQPKCMLRLSALCTAPRDVASPERN
jgi:hypothetical protein